ncbi:malonyl-CoA decarboxylase [Chelativorans sp. AA-79]|uniref:malonyl-CoA decarboxylase n=1 Tax=Chelativorans sp. AA-79 TaxID=3028735 RepID=UPI0023F8B827|nr:malonyl-CoA decarboxylase [Chelativorans sp. AA-79]WEX11854.1 malonyl-CoA decarboxylase [Chelativorans sp. AA-79]
MCELLLSRRGEATGVALASVILDAYGKADADAQLAFLRILLNGFDVDQEALEKAIEAYGARRDPVSASKLHDAAEPKRQELFRRLNMAPGGTQALVRMREHLLQRLHAEPELSAVDTDFIHLFSSWFNRGFLTLQAMDWRTPANILEKIIRYEAVHEITDWDELRRRVEPGDRRCFAFFHPQMPDEPLIFVEVALAREIVTSMDVLLDPDRTPIPAEAANTAVFYSISNCQAGLKGVSFGSLLIKQVVADLQQELPNLRKFVTLSPVPGFAEWLRQQLAEPSSHLISKADRAVLGAADLLSPGEHVADVRKALLSAAAAYLLHAKRADGQPLDPVARFHLGNGARLQHINLLADRSGRAVRQSIGIMVNYLYDPKTIEENHELFAESRQVVASPETRKLFQGDSIEIERA